MNIDDYNNHPQDDRISMVFGISAIRRDGDPHYEAWQDWPAATDAALDAYLVFLTEHLKSCRLTGCVPTGYFSWEERYIFSNKDDPCKHKTEERGRMDDIYLLLGLDGHEDVDIGLLTKVKRISDGKLFTIPLQDLECEYEQDAQYKIIDDYCTWIVNYG